MREELNKITAINDMKHLLSSVRDLQNEIHYYIESQREGMKHYKTVAELSYSLGSSEKVLGKIQRDLGSLANRIISCHSDINRNVNKLISGELKV